LGLKVKKMAEIILDSYNYGDKTILNSESRKEAQKTEKNCLMKIVECISKNFCEKSLYIFCKFHKIILNRGLRLVSQIKLRIILSQNIEENKIFFAKRNLKRGDRGV